MDYIYLRAGRRGWGVKANLIFLSWGAVGGSKQIRTKKANFFCITFIWIIFFSNGRLRQEEG